MRADKASDAFPGTMPSETSTLGSFVVLLVAGLAGCVAALPAPGDDPDPAPTPAPSASPLHIEETLWLPLSVGMEPARIERAFTTNASFDSLRLDFVLAWTITDRVPPPASAMVTVRDPGGDVAGEAMMAHGGPHEATIEIASPVAGAYGLLFETYGGSDGGSAGDYLSYVIQSGWARQPFDERDHGIPGGRG